MGRSQRQLRETRGMDSYGDDKEQPLWLQPPSSGERFINRQRPTGGPTVAIHSTVPATEGDPIVATFRRSAPFTGVLQFRYTISPVTADQSDVSSNFGTYTFSFADGQEFASVNIGTVDDSIAEPGEVVRLTVAFWTGYSPAAPVSTTVTITDNEVFPTVTVQPTAFVEEGTIAPTSTTVTFTRSGSASAPLEFVYSVTPGSAVSSDVVGGMRSYTTQFDAESNTKVIQITVEPDEIYEPDEVFYVNVQPSSQYIVGSPSMCEVTIYDDDSLPVINLFSFNGVTEGSSLSVPNAMTAIFTRTGPVSAALDFLYGVDGGTADAADLVDGIGTFVGRFSPGESNAVVYIPVTSDTVVEANETVEITIVPNPAFYTVGGTSTLIASINNDDAVQLPVVSIQGVADAVEGTAIPFYLLRTGDAANALTINYSVGGGSATSDDIVGGFGNFTADFPAGSNDLTITVTTVDDATVENTETVVLTILPGTGYNIAPPSFAAGIIDNDVPLPEVNIQSFTSASEGAAGSGGNLVVVFSRSGSTAGSLAFNYTISGGTATAADLVGGFGARTSSFDIGSATKAISLAIAGDSIAEGDETVLVSLGASAAYNVGASSTMLATILDDDSVVGTLPQPVLVWDTDTSVSTPQFDIEISTPQVGDTVTVQWADNPSFLPQTGSVTRTFELSNLDEVTVNLFLGGVVNGLWYYRARHSRGVDTSAWSNIAIVTVNDVTAPIITDPYCYSASGDLAFLEVTTDEASDKIAVVVTSSSTPPTAEQIYTGKDHTGANALAYKIQQIATAGTQYLTLPDVQNGTNAYFVQRDLAGNYSNILPTLVKSPISFGYIATLVSTSDRAAGASYTFAATNLGSLANRKLKMAIQLRASTAALVVSVTVAGQPCTLEYNGSTTSDVIQFFTTDGNVSAATGDIVVTITGGSATLCMVDLYEITGTAVMREAVQGQRSPSGTVLETPNFRIWDGGAAAMTCMGVGSSNVITWNGHVEVYDNSVEFVRRVSAFSQTPTPQGQTTKVSIADTNAATRRIAAISWGPA